MVGCVLSQLKPLELYMLRFDDIILYFVLLSFVGICTFKTSQIEQKQYKTVCYCLGVMTCHEALFTLLHDSTFITS